MTLSGPRRLPLWLVPLAYTILSVVAGLLLPRLEARWLGEWVVDMPAGSALAFFSAVSSGMMALTGIVFAIAFVTVQFSTAVYSPRLMIMFGRDPLLFHTLGLFIATFSYSLAALAWVDQDGKVPAVSAYLVILMLIGSMVAFARLIQSIEALQIHNVLQLVGDCGRAVIAEMFPHLDTDVSPAAVPDPARFGPAVQTLSYDGAPRTIIRLDIPRLVRIAERAGVVIVMDCAVGDTLVEGATLLRVHGPTALPEPDLLSCLAVDRARTFEQDPKYAIRMLVDIAIRALSPAINDPTTAVQVLDQIEDLLNRLGRRALEANTASDPSGQVRLVIQVPSWAEYVALAFDEIRQYGADSVQVMRRLRAALTGLAANARTTERAAEIQAYIAHLDLTVSRSDLDERDQRSARQQDRQGLGLTRGAGGP